MNAIEPRMDAAAELKALRARVAELESSERQLRAMLATAPQGMIVHTDRVLYCNDAAVRLFGYASAEELRNLPSVDQLFAQESQGELRERRSARLRGDPQPEFYEMQGVCKDGTRRWLRMAVQRVQWDGEHAVHCTYTDISARKRAEEKLEENRRLLRAVLDGLPQWVAVKDREERYVLVNRAFEEALGRPLDAIVGCTARELGADFPGTPDPVEASDRHVLMYGETSEVPEFAVKLRDGTTSIRHVIKVPLRDEAGDVIGVACMSTDISERQRAQEELRAQRRLLQNVVDTIPHFVYVKDRQSRYLLLNRAMMELFNLRPEQVLGQPPERLPFATEAQRREFIAKDEEVFSSGGRVDDPQFEATVADGSTRTFRSVKMPLRDEAGEVIGLVGVAEDITEQQRAQAELLAQRRLLQSVMETIPLGVYVKDRQSRLLMANQAMARLFGVEPGALTGIPTEQIPNATGEDRHVFMQQDAAVFASGEPLHVPEYYVTQPSGERRTFRGIKVPLRDEAGEMIGLVGVAEDITEQQRAQAELATQRQLLQSVFDTVPSWLFVKDREARYLMVNDTMARDAGRPAAAFVGESVWDVPQGTQAERARSAQGDRRVLETGQPLEREGHVTLPDGRVTWRHVRKMPVLDEHGRVARIVGMSEDITSRRAMEDEVRAQRRLLQTVFDAIPTWLFVKDRDGRFLMVNDTFARDVKRCPSEFRGLAHDDAPQGTPAQREKIRRDDERIVTEGRPLELEEELTLPDGRVTVRHVRKVPLRNEQGEIIGIVGISEDVTERRQMEEQLRRMQRMEAIGTLAGGIAHDFNNILFPIIGFTELTLKELPSQSVAHHNLDIVRDAALRAKDIVSQILTFSRRSENRPEVIDPLPLVRETLRFLRSTLPRTVRIEEQIAGAVSSVYADGVQLHQVLMNLCVNAAHAMPDGGTLTVLLDDVTVSDYRGYTGDRIAGACVRLRVSDTGAGMDDVTLTRIFEPFFTTKPVGQGTGLGLSTVLGIVSQHKGVIDVQSAPGEGTTFEVLLPAVKRRAEVPEPVGYTPREEGDAAILFVDDEEAITELATHVLEEHGYRVTGFTSSTAALAAFKADPQSFDMVITDQMMPELTGDKLVRAVRDVRTDIPILLGTGYSEVITPEGAVELGIDEVFYKPLTPTRLCDLVREALRHAPARRGTPRS